MARITGIGGVFFKSADPKALSAWYRDVLGLELQDWGGAMLAYDAPGHPPHVVWTPFAADTKYFAPSTREFMINLAVDDLEAILASCAEHGVEAKVLPDESNGRFAHILDPEGTMIELWQPRPMPD